MKKSIPILMLVLLLAKPDWAFTGAKNGLVLWGMVVLPTLMPFMLCSQAVAGLGAVPLFMKPFRPFFTHILHLSDQGGYVLFSGLLCGYPMGAKTCRDFLEKGWIGKAEARFLFAISNHPSPMFLLGYVMNQLGSVLDCLATSHPGRFWFPCICLSCPSLLLQTVFTGETRRNFCRTVPKNGKLRRMFFLFLWTMPFYPVQRLWSKLADTLCCFPFCPFIRQNFPF